MRFTKSFRALRSILFRGSLGQRAEAVAARYLQKQGLQILARNWRTRQGEIDIVALAGSIVVFVEVKSRTLGNTAPGVTDERDPLERIDHEKVQRIRRAARSYLRRARGSYQGSRIDGLVIDFTRGFAGRKVPASIRWYQALHSME